MGQNFYKAPGKIDDFIQHVYAVKAYRERAVN